MSDFQIDRRAMRVSGRQWATGARRQRRRRRIALAVASVAAPLVGAAPALRAAPLYWDTNDTAAGSSTANAAWTDTSTNWSADPTGVAAPGVWQPGGDAVFAAGTTTAGTYSVTVTGTHSVNSILLEDSVVNIGGGAGGVLDFTGLAGTITNARNVTNTIGATIAGGDITFLNASTGSAVLNITAAPTFTGNLNIGAGTGRTATTQIQLDHPLANPAAAIRMRNFSLLGNTNTAGNFAIPNTIHLNVDAVDDAESYIASSNGKIVTYAGVISGTSNVNFSINNAGGRGTVVLGAQNTYVGDTYVNLAPTNGLLQLGVDNALPAATNLTFGGTSAGPGTNGVGPMDMNGKSLTVASLATNTSGNVTGIYNTAPVGQPAPADATLTIDGPTSTTYKGVIGRVTGAAPWDGSQSGSPYAKDATAFYSNIALVKNGTSTLTLTGASTYTGDTTINGGAIALGRTGVGQHTLASNVIVNNGGTLSSVASPNDVPVGGTSQAITLNSGGHITPGGAGGTAAISGTGSFTFNSGGQVTFDLASLSQFDQLLFAGTLSLDSAGTHTVNVAGSNLVPGTYTLIKADSGIAWDGVNGFSLGSTPAGTSSFTLTQTGTELQLNVLANALRWDVGGGGLPITEGGGAWANGSTDFIDLSNNTQAAWDNSGSNDVIIGGDANQVGGQIDLGSAIRTGGKLTFGPIWPDLGYTISDGGDGSRTLTTVGGIVVNASATIDANVVLGASQTWAVDAGQTLTVNKSLTQAGGAHTLSKTGAGTVVIGGAGGNVAAVNVTGGTLALGAVDAVGAAPISIDGANLGLGGTGSYTNAITFGAAGGGIGPANGAEATLAGNLSSTGLVTVAGSGRLNLGGANNFAGGLRVIGATVGISDPAAIAGGPVTLHGSASSIATLAVTAPINIPSNFTFTGTGAGGDNNRIDVGTNHVTFSGVLTSGGDWAKFGTGDITLAGVNALNGGAFNVRDATTVHFAPGAAWGDQTIAVFAPTTIDPQGDLSIGAVRGPSTFTKVGASRLTVSGNTGAGGVDPALHVIVDGGSIQMNSLPSLGGNNGTATAPRLGATLTLNAGTALYTNWAGSRNSQNVTLNDATLTALATSPDGATEFTSYLVNDTTHTNFGGVLTVNGSSTIHNQRQAAAGVARGLQVHMPIVVSPGATLTVQADNAVGNGDRAAVILRGVSDNTAFAGDNVTLHAGATLVTQGAGEVHLGGTGRGKPILAQGTPGSDAVMKLGSHTFLRDNGEANDRTGGTEMTKLVVNGSGSAGLRVEAPMNATYTVPDPAGAPALRPFDGTTGLFGVNTTATVDATALPSGYDNIGHGYTVLSAKRAAALSNTYTTANGTVIEQGGTLTLAATDAAGATGTVNAGPATPGAVALALDNTATSGHLVYEIDPAANGATFGNFSKLTVQRSNPGAGTVSAKLLGVTKVPGVAVTGGATLDVADKALITDTPAGAATGGVYAEGSIHRLAQTAYQESAWGGPGLTTSMEDAKSGLTALAILTGEQYGSDTFMGQSISPTSTIVMYTYGGDSNLDGKLDADDYGTIDFNVLLPQAVDGYHNGDFNYDGIVNADDYGVIDFNILAQKDPFPTSGAAVASGSGSAGLSGVTAVPEPSALGIALVAAAGMFGRRRRRRRAAGSSDGRSA